MKTVIL